MAHGDLNRRTTADKELRDKAFNITKNPKYVRYQLYKFLEKENFCWSS